MSEMGTGWREQVEDGSEIDFVKGLRESESEDEIYRYLYCQGLKTRVVMEMSE